MKIYVITKGDYSDYHICAVTEDKDKAKELKKIFTDDWREANIEEYETNDCQRMLTHKYMYKGEVLLDGRVVVRNIEFDYIQPKEIGEVVETPKCKLYTMYTYINANCEEDALKIAKDRFAPYLALKKGV